MKTVISTTLASVSKGKKPKNHRSIFLSAMMKGLGGDAGNAVAEAYVGSDTAKFKDEMAKIVDKVAGTMPKAK